MILKSKELKGLRLGAQDGDIGHVRDFYFDDQTWTVRYLVADTGSWLRGRQVLISPHALGNVHPPPHKVLEVALTKQQIEESPPIAADAPVSRQFEQEYYRYFNWPAYWGGPWDWGTTPYPGAFVTEALPPPPAETQQKQEGNPHLRSISEVSHYAIQALNDHFGHVADFLLDPESWSIRYLVVDTRSWWPGKKVLLAPQWIAWVSWSESRVYVDLDRETVQRAPEYDPVIPVTRDYEAQLFEHYGQTPYWEHPAQIPS